MPHAPKGPNSHSRSSASSLSVKARKRPQCLICYTTFGQKKDLKRHMENIHLTKRLKYRCNYPGCTTVMSQKSNLMTHQKIHTGTKDKVCTWPSPKSNGEMCVFKCTDPSSFHRHLKSHVRGAIDKNEDIPEGFHDIKERILKSRAQKQAESRESSSSSNSAAEVEHPEPVGPSSSACASSSQHAYPSSETSLEDYVAAWICESPAACTDSAPSGYASPSDGDLSDISDISLSSSSSFEEPGLQAATPATHVAGPYITQDCFYPDHLTVSLQSPAVAQVPQVQFPRVPQYAPYPESHWPALYDLMHEAPKPQPTQVRTPEYPTSLGGIGAMLYQDMSGNGNYFPSLSSSL